MDKTKFEELKAVLYRTAVDYQRNFYEISSDWNSYNQNEHIYLKNFISYAIYGPPDVGEIKEYCEDKVYEYKDSKIESLVGNIYNKVVEHGTQLSDGKEVLCNILYSCIYDENSLNRCDELRVNELIHIIPVFKVQKNVKMNNQINLQNWYVDTEARVYKSWEDYLKNNNLPTSVMIAPKDGVYQADLREVWSDTHSVVWLETQNLHPTKKLTSTVDTASTLVNIASVGIGIAALLNPISAPIMIAGAVGGTVSGAWQSGRAVQELVDRKSHDQSISITNKRALPAWLGVAGNTLGLAAKGSSKLLSRAMQAGATVGQYSQLPHDAITVGNLLVNSTGTLNTLHNVTQKYRETGELSDNELSHLTSYVLFVCNSAVKTRVVSEIIKSDQVGILRNFEESLRRKRHKKEFRRLVRNSEGCIADELSRNKHIVRSLIKISDKDEFFTAMVQNGEILASKGTQQSPAEDQMQINGVTLISPKTIASMLKDNTQLNLITQAPARDPSSYISRTITKSSSSKNLDSVDVFEAGISTVRSFCVQNSVTLLTSNFSQYKNIINDLQNVPETTLTQIMQLLLSTGLCITKRVMITPRYTEEEALADATNFFWNIVKLNASNSLSGVDMFLPKNQHYIKKFVEATHIYVINHAIEWDQLFSSFLKREKSPPENLIEDVVPPKMLEKAPSGYLSEDSIVDSRPRYNDILFTNPAELMSLPKDILAEIIYGASIHTGRAVSKLSGRDQTSQELLAMCNNEVSEFFSKHPIQLAWEPMSLSSEVTNILKDLECFDKKNVILYKILFIAINIVQSIVERNALRLNELADLMEFLWIFTNITFNELLPNANMVKSEYEPFIMNIIIGIYRFQIQEPTKWSSAFHEYKSKFCAD